MRYFWPCHHGCHVCHVNFCESMHSNRRSKRKGGTGMTRYNIVAFFCTCSIWAVLKTYCGLILLASWKGFHNYSTLNQPAQPCRTHMGLTEDRVPLYSFVYQSVPIQVAFSGDRKIQSIPLTSHKYPEYPANRGSYINKLRFHNQTSHWSIPPASSPKVTTTDVNDWRRPASRCRRKTAARW